MHSVREGTSIGDRLTTNLEGPGPGAMRPRHAEASEPYAGGRVGGPRYSDDRAPRGGGDLKFMTYRAFCNSEEARVAELQTPDQFHQAYLAYKVSFKNEYLAKVLEQDPGLLQSKVGRTRAETKSVIAQININKEVAAKRSLHFVARHQAGAFSAMHHMAPAISDPQGGVELMHEEQASLPDRVQVREVDLEQLRGGDAPVMKTEGSDVTAPLVVEGPYLYLDPQRNALELRDVPDWLSREQVQKYLVELGLDQQATDVEMSFDNIDMVRAYWDSLGEKAGAEPPALQRSIHLQFDTPAACAEGMQQMLGRPINNGADSYTPHPVQLAPLKAVRLRILPAYFSHPKVVEMDLALTRTLIYELSMKLGILSEGNQEHDHPLLAEQREDMSLEEKLRLLDLQVTYLGYAHNLDYYAMPPTLKQSTCDLMSGGDKKKRVVAGPFNLTVRSYTPNLEESMNEIAKQHDEFEVNIAKHEEEVKALTNSIRDETMPTAIDAEHPQVSKDWEAYIETNIIHAENSRARCGVCEKLFKGSDFVTKHIQNKHFDKIDQVIERIEEKEMEARLLNDPLALYLINAPIVDDKGQEKGRGRTDLASFNHYTKQIGGPVRRGHTPWNDSNNTYRDWDAPTISRSMKAVGFRKCTNYDDL